MVVNATDPKWDKLISRIKDGTCILVTGPNIGISDPEKTINATLKSRLINDENSDKIKHYSDDEFFSFKDLDPDEKEEAIDSICNYYKGLKPTDIHQKIAEIPFHLIISVSPDHMIKDVFREKKIDHTFDYYNKQQNPAALEQPTIAKPLIYNLFGDIDNQDSLIFTYDDLFDYLIKIFGDFKLPRTLQNELLKGKRVLFLGFDFDKWYFKLLLRLLNINKEVIKHASNKERNIMPNVMSFYLEEFALKLYEYNETDILDTIYQKCAAEGILRSKSIPAANSSAEVFISYGHGGESDTIADCLESSLKNTGINFIRDKNDLGYGGNLKKFMQSIGKGKYVIVIISDKYLRSEYCMYELLEITKNGDIYNRIFPIVLNDANIYDFKSRIEYTNYWARKKGELNELINSMEDKTGSRQLIEQLDQFDDIKKFFVEITTTLGNMNALTPDRHMQSDFTELINALEQKIQQDSK